ncbi:TonB-dependent receptor plug domain-containing protein [Pelagicoccus sp. SDUM812005]|uniref:TonB-dependent receptor plug domain-containing protein n=1 Tax=Pelagicoccus sp. SDUM812005 TaxID=3041257 RepID=UPI002811381F|nr:TonB-dependent receptor plug domain-containing protein [Pelagicoccus sp. SDUM812005]
MCAPILSVSLFAQEEEEEIFELSPFQVDGSGDVGYYSSQTLAGGRLNTSLKNVATSVQVVTKEFMEDIGATSLDEVFAYTTSTEAFGPMSDYQQVASRSNDDQQQAGDLDNSAARQNPNAASRVRGMAAPTRTSNYFATSIPFDSYNSSRIDINRGANSFLFGLGSPGGIVNIGLESAHLNKDSVDIDFRVSTENFENNFSNEISVNLNKVILQDKLALRLAAKERDDEFMQKPAFTDASRQYAALRYKPFAEHQISLSANYERGDSEFISIERNGPLETLSTFIDNPLGDKFGPVGTISNEAQRYILDGFGNMLKNSAEGNVAYTGRDINGTPLDFAFYNNFFVKRNGWMPVYDGTENAAGYPTRAVDTGWTNNRVRRGSPTWDPDNNLLGNTSLQFASNPMYSRIGTTALARGGQDYTGWVNQGLLDYEVFDFRKNLITGSNDLNSNDFDRHMLSFEAVSESGNYGVSIDYAAESFESSGFSLSGSPRIDIDINYSLPVGPNDLFGATNPNFGRLYIYASAASRTEYANERESARATAFAKVDLKEKFEGGIFSWLGRHTISGLADKNSLHEETLVKKPLVFGNDADWHIATNTQVFQRQSSAIFYLSDPYLNAFEDPNFSLADFHTTGVDPRVSVDMPEGYMIPLAYKSEGDPLTQPLRTTVLGDEHLAYGEYSSQFTYTDGNLSLTKTRSQALNLQSFFLNDLLVANLGWRTDKVDLQRAQAPFTTTFPENLPILDPEFFNLDEAETLSAKKSNFGYGLVLKAPSQWLGEGMSLSFHYGENSNFVAVPGLNDFEGNTVPNQSGETKDYGLTLGLMNDKLVLRLNAYEANIVDENYSDTSNAYRQFLNVRSREFGALFVALDGYDQNRDGVFDLEPDPNAPGGFIDIDANKNGYVDSIEPGGAAYVEGAEYMSLAQLNQFYDAYAPLWNDWVSEQLQFVFTPKSDTTVGSYSSVQFPSNVLSDTVDLNAKGYELELTYNPSRKLRLAFNASQSTAQRSNVAPRMGYLVDRVIEIFESVPNAPRLTAMNVNALETPLAPANFDGTDLLGSSLNNAGQGGAYFIAKALEGSDTPELSKYSFNVLGNYTFGEGRMKGFNTGAAYRWTDKRAIGYPNGLDASGRFVVGDVSNPYYNEDTGYADLWIGYRRKLFEDKVNWKVQLNARNVFADSDPVAIQTQPDGSIARVSIPVPRQFVLSNTFSF